MTRFMFTALGLLLAGSAAAQVSITSPGTPYTQNFDTLPASGNVVWANNTTIPGWFHARTGSGTTIVADNGSANAGAFYSYGTGTDTERALGSLGSGNAAVGSLFWGVRLQNNTGSTITSLHVAYVGEQWRNSAAAAQTISFSYLVGSPTVTGSLAEFQSAGVAVAALNFTSPITGGVAGALDGNAPANRVAISHTITGLSIPAGSEIMLRWSDPDHAGADHGLAIDDFSVSACNTVCFTGGGLIIPSNGLATPYPSTINVAGLAGDIVDLTVRINGFSHTFPRDVDMLLVAPNGQRSIVFSDAGGGNPGVVNFNLAFNDAAATLLPQLAPPVSGTTYRPTDFEIGDSFPAPAPVGPHPTGFAAFFGPAAALNGTWQLFVVDDFADDAGSMAGWALEFTLGAPDADLSVTLADSPDPVVAGTNLTYTAVATNGGPADAEDVSITLPLPAGTSFVSATPSAGGVCNAASPVVCSWAGATALAGERTATIVALVAPDTAGPLEATATAASTTDDPEPGNNLALATTAVDASADLSITLADAPDPVISGDNLTYTAVATNGGPSDAQDVSITLPLPAGTSFVSATPSAGGVCNAASPVVCTWAGATAPAGAHTATIVALVAPETSGTLEATATVASTSADPEPGNNSAIATTAVDASADLSITLVDAPDPVTAGNSLTYTAVATNGGPSDAQDVSISLPLPAGTGFVSATPSAGGACNAASPVVCTWAGATAPAGAHTATIVALVAPNASGTLEATATVASTTADPEPGNNSAIATTAVDGSADLSITLVDAPDPVTAGNNLTYAATASNAGPSDAQDVSITLPLPAGTSFVSATPSAGGACNAASPVICTWAGATPPAGAHTATIVALVAPNASGTLEATATVASTSADPEPGNNSAIATTSVDGSADLSITLADAPDPVTAGNNLTYTAVATNGGPSDAQDVSITLPLPAGTSFVSATPSAGGACNAASPVVCTWAGTTAPAGTHSAIIVALVAPGTTGILGATATVTSTTADPEPANNTASSSTAVNVVADLAISKSNGATVSTPGTSTIYTIVASNAGPSDAPGSVVVDNFPSACIGVTWTCAGAGGGSCTANGAGNINDVVNLPAGGSVSFSATCPIDLAALGTLVNTATVTAAGGVSDPDLGNNSATDTDTLGASADLSITKEAVAVPTPLLVGSTFRYTLTASNAGPSSATAVVVSDTLPATLELVSNDCGATYAAPTLTWSIGSLAPGASEVCNLDVVVAELGVISNTASISSATADSAGGNNASTSTLTGAEQTDVAISLTSSAMPGIDVGDSFVLTVIGTNNGPGVAYELDFTLTLSNRVSFVSSTCGAVLTGNTLNWTVATLASGAQTSCQITVTVVLPGADQVTASVSTLTFDPDLGNNSANLASGTVANPISSPAIIPTLSHWVLLLLALLIGGLGVVVIRR